MATWPPTVFCRRAFEIRAPLSALPFVLPIPYRDPSVAFAPLANANMSVLLHSALASPQGRYSYIARDPFSTISCTPHPWRVSIDGRFDARDPFTVLADTLAQFPANE